MTFALLYHWLGVMVVVFTALGCCTTGAYGFLARGLFIPMTGLRHAVPMMLACLVLALVGVAMLIGVGKTM